MSPSIYLGGPVSSFLEDKPSYAAYWRDQFPQLLNSLCAQESFSYQNPCIGQYNEQHDFSVEPYNRFRFSDNYIFDNCVTQILSSDILLFNFLNAKDVVSPGSFWEMGFGFGLKTKFMILIAEEGSSLRKHPILKASTNFVASDLTEAAQYCLYCYPKLSKPAVNEF